MNFISAYPQDAEGLSPIIFEFDNEEDAFRGAAALYRNLGYRVYKSSFFSYGKRYRIAIYPLDYADNLSAAVLAEYGNKVGKGELLLALTDEHGKKLVSENALEILTLHFGN